MNYLFAALLALQSSAATSDRDLARIAMDGWRAARAVAAQGGAVELLGPVNASLKALDAYPQTAARYAEVAIRAAVSAAQEERDEMALFLEHARALSQQMGAVGPVPTAPLPIDELSGELWLEVDRFAEARESFERAVAVAPTPNAWMGLARAADKLGDRVTACRGYLAVKGTRGLPGEAELEASLYLLKCQF